MRHHPAPVPRVTPTTINGSGWNLNRRTVSAVCLYMLVVCPTSIRGEIVSFTGSDGRRIYSNTRNTTISPARSSPPLEPAPPTGARAGNRPPAGINRLIDRIAGKHRMDPELVKAVAKVESNYNPRAISHKGAQGIMQLVPATAKRFGVTDAFDPAQNIEGGVRYLKFLRDRFPDSLSLVLAAYNAGEHAVRKHGGIPPYRETRDYVRKIRQLYGQNLPNATAGGMRPKIVSYRDSAGRLVYSNLHSDYR